MRYSRDDQSKAIANDLRRQMLDWLKNPGAHFGHQVTGDPAEIGVCVTLLTEKAGISQPTVSRHLDILSRAGLLTVRRQGRWSFYSRNESEIRAYREWVHDCL